MEKADRNELMIEVVAGAPKFMVQAQLDRIAIPTPKKYIKTREGKGGRKLDYVDTPYIIATLNGLFGFMWDFEIMEESTPAEAMLFESVRVKGKLTVHDTKGNCVTKMNYGSQPLAFKKNADHTEKNLSTELGDAYKGSASDCLKKCSSMFGIALDVYSGDTNKEREAGPAEDDGIIDAETTEDKAIVLTTAQIGLLFATAKEKFPDSTDVDKNLHLALKEKWNLDSVKDIKSENLFQDILVFFGGDKFKKKPEEKKPVKREKVDTSFEL